MQTDLLNNPIYQTLNRLKQCVEAIEYYAGITPENELEKSLKVVVAERLKTDFDKHYVDIITLLSDIQSR